MATKKTKFKDLIKRKSQLDQEIEQYERLVSTAPNEARYLTKLGDLYLEKGERKKGIKLLVKAADSFNESGFYFKSIAIFKKILRLGKGSIDIYLKLGGLYQKNGLLGDALSQYKMVINLSKHTGTFDKAIAILQKKIDEDSSSVELRLKFADFLYEENLKEEAIKELLKAASLLRDLGDNEGFDRVRENVMKLYHELNSTYQSARRDITKMPFYPLLSSLFQEEGVVAAKEDEQENLSRPLKIKAPEGEGEKEKERKEGALSKPAEIKDQKREMSEEETPSDLSVSEDEILLWLEEAQIYTEQGLYGEAEQLYRKILRLTPQDEFVISQLKGLEGKIKGDVSAIDVSDVFSKYEILKKDDEFDVGSLAQQITAQLDKESEEADLKIHYELGLAYKELGLFDEALEQFHIAVKDPKWQLDSYSALAECHMEKGSFFDAIKCYQMALNQKGLSKNAMLEISYQLGKAYENNGMAKEALATYKQIALMDREYKDVQQKVRTLNA